MKNYFICLMLLSGCATKAKTEIAEIKDKPQEIDLISCRDGIQFRSRCLAAIRPSDFGGKKICVTYTLASAQFLPDGSLVGCEAKKEHVMLEHNTKKVE